MAGSVSGIILSGGQNSRMKANKAFLKVDGLSIIENTIKELNKFCSEVIVVTNEPDLYMHLGVRTVTDVIPCMGPLSGIHAGLLSASTFHSFVAACDMPFIDGCLAQYMIDHIDDNDVFVPQVGDYLQPLFAVYTKKCIPPIEKCLGNAARKIPAFYHEVRVKYLSETIIREYTDILKAFLNVNTPEELAGAQKLAAQNKG
jgi:molybdopterin-guanine dinucleotide biosynthesis protein A